MIDAIVCPDWEMRYYSFNAKWSDGQSVASMRDGSGSHWFIHYLSFGCLFKGFYKDCFMATSDLRFNILKEVPVLFQESINEPAFMMNDTTFCIWQSSIDSVWEYNTIDLPNGNDIDGFIKFSSILDGDPKSYQEWAEDYFGVEIKIDLIEAIYSHVPLNEKLVYQINPDITLQDLNEDVLEIGYPCIKQ